LEELGLDGETTMKWVVIKKNRRT